MKVLSAVVEGLSTDTEIQNKQEARQSFAFIDDETGESLSDDMDMIACEFEKAGIWERETEDAFRFIHDQIQVSKSMGRPCNTIEHLTSANLSTIRALDKFIRTSLSLLPKILFLLR